MRFEEIIPVLKEGKKIKRKDWGKEEYITKHIFFVLEQIVTEKNGVYALTVDDLCADDWEVYKGTKKVSLRDLTEEQYSSRHKNHCNCHCEDCRFKAVTCNYKSKHCWLNHKDLYSDKFLDQEVEIEDE